MSGKLYNVGKIVNTHGVKGEVKVVTQTDFPDVRFAKGSSLLLVDPASGQTVPVTVESGRPQKNVYMVRFEGMDGINSVEPYRNWLIKVTEDELVELDEDEFYHHEIIGCRVVTDEGEELGTIGEIMSPGANDVWVVNRPKGKDILIPYIDDVVLSVDVENKLVTVQLLEGLL